jgi:hypothetical protein
MLDRPQLSTAERGVTHPSRPIDGAGNGNPGTPTSFNRFAALDSAASPWQDARLFILSPRARHAARTAPPPPLPRPRDPSRPRLPALSARTNSRGTQTNPPLPSRTSSPCRAILPQPNEPSQPFESARFLCPGPSRCPLDSAAAGSPPAPASAGRDPGGPRRPPRRNEPKGRRTLILHKRIPARSPDPPLPHRPLLAAHATVKRRSPSLRASGSVPPRRAGQGGL